MIDGPYEYDRHDDNDEPYPIEYDRFFLWVSICLSVSMNMLVRSALDRAPARKLALAGTPAQASLAPSLRSSTRKKISGTEVRRNSDEMTNQAL